MRHDQGQDAIGRRRHLMHRGALAGQLGARLEHALQRRRAALGQEILQPHIADLQIGVVLRDRAAGVQPHPADQLALGEAEGDGIGGHHPVVQFQVQRHLTKRQVGAGDHRTGDIAHDGVRRPHAGHVQGGVGQQPVLRGQLGGLGLLQG